MSAIREELTLVDKFTQTFSKYISMGKQASASTQAASSANAGYNDRMAELGNIAAEAGRSLIELSEKIKDAGDGSSKAAKEQEKHNKKMREGANASDKLASKLKTLITTYAGLRTAQKFINLTDTFTETTARLNRMNDGNQTTGELQDMIYRAAQRSRGGYQDMSDMVSKLGTMAPDAFGSTSEVVAFAEQINKQFALAGTNIQGQQAAMLQLTQAMSSGVLRGEELNSVLEQAPTIAQTIAKYLGVSVGEMRKMASEGEITAQVVKEAMFAAAEETNAAFEDIPLTFGQVWTMAGNAAVHAMQPAMQKLNDLLNSDLGKKAINGLMTGFELLGSAASGVIDLLVNGAQWVADNWDTVSTVLQFAGGAVLAFTALSVASSLRRAAAWAIEHWFITLFVVLIGSAIMAMYSMGMSSEEVFSKIGAGAGWLYTFVYNMVAAVWNLIATFAEFFANVFDNPVAAIANLFLGLFNFIMDVVSNAAGAIDALLGTNMSGAVKKFQNGVNDFVTGIFGENKIKLERMEQITYADTMEQWSQVGASIGKALDDFSLDGMMDKFSEGAPDYAAMMANSGIPGQLDSIGGDVAAIKKSVSMSEEDMKLLVDMAERQYVNNINLTAQTPVITIYGQNTGDTEKDLQWLEDALTKLLVEQAASHTDLSYQT